MKVRAFLGPLSLMAAALWVAARSGTGVLADTDNTPALIWPDRLAGTFTAYLSDSPVGLIAYRLLGFTTLRQFWLLSLVAVIASMALLAAWVYRTAPRENRYLATRLLILAPVSGVLLVWIGSYDPWTILCWAVVLFAWTSGVRWLAMAAGVLLGFQHFEHSMLGLITLGLVWLGLRELAPEGTRRLNPFWIMPGLVIGKLLLVLVFALHHTALTGRTQWLGPFLHEWTAAAVDVAPLMLWSLFAGWWAVVIYLALEHTTRRSVLLLSAAFAVGLLASVLSGDRPRVFVVVLAPAVAFMAVVFANRIKAGSREHIVIESIVWLAPPIFFWGKVVVSANVVDLAVMAWQQLSP